MRQLPKSFSNCNSYMPVDVDYVFKWMDVLVVPTNGTRGLVELL